MSTDLLTFGEEFEFLTSQGQEFSKEEVDRTLKQWRDDLVKILGDNSIQDYSIEPSQASLDIRIGNWFYKIYDDYNVLEVNTSPYRLDQIFTIHKLSLTAYQCFDNFVLDIAKGMHLCVRSGHKHIGIDKALYGNSEILLRLLIDVEKRAWLPRVFLREKRSENNFCYAKQSLKYPTFVLKALVAAFNQQLQTNPARKIDENFDSFINLTCVLDEIGLWQGKIIPLNLQHLSASAPEHECEGVRKARTTIEFRFPQTPRTGEEAKRLNQLFAAWLQLMERHQHHNTPLALELNDPMSYAEGKDDEVISLFHDFVQELGLEWDTFRHCSFLPHENS